jgi:hypothetical protein
MIRKGRAEWRGTGRDGNGDLSTDSGVLAKTPYSFKTRFQSEKGTNLEELIGCPCRLLRHGSGLSAPDRGFHADVAVDRSRGVARPNESQFAVLLSWGMRTYRSRYRRSK